MAAATMTATLADCPTLALAALAAATPGLAVAPDWTPKMLRSCVTALRAACPDPAQPDGRLIATAAVLDLTDAELMAVALCLAAERDPEAARAIAEAQAPLGRSRPLLGLAATALAPLGASCAGIAYGTAVASGLLHVSDEPVALPERSLSVPMPVQAALAGALLVPAGVRVMTPRPVPLPEDVVAEAAVRAATLRARPRSGLVVRARSAADGVAIAALVAHALGLDLARVETGDLPTNRDGPAGLAPWLIAAGMMPLFTPDLGPGQRWMVPRPPFYAGPWIVVTNPESAVEAEDLVEDWTPPASDPAARARLWRKAGTDPASARRAAETFRHGAARIAEVAERAKQRAARRAGRPDAHDVPPDWSDIAAAVASGAAGLDALARRGGGEVPDEALVLPPSLRESLDRLLDRARARGTLADDLGPAVRARYRPGVRALLVGESGTGKTLAAHWLAARLGLPLYRVDLAALTSKYIGETEKNLSAILGAAEHADVLLFFDEADALFGARTDVGDAHDRYANAQTNYLLQRIEDFDGIAVLASNSRDRFDPAFTRRLDAILEFPMPEGPARHALWVAHLGAAHGLVQINMDRLSVSVDLAGGHIRNIVLAAAARAKAQGVPIGWSEIVPSVREEYAKLGRPPPDLGPC
jgi:ATPase family associated with various cellular activities (AAA)